jgi:hypothetical protein
MKVKNLDDLEALILNNRIPLVDRFAVFCKTLEKYEIFTIRWISPPPNKIDPNTITDMLKVLSEIRTTGNTSHTVYITVTENDLLRLNTDITIDFTD